MFDFARTAKVSAAALLAMEMLTGCATRYCCSKVAEPKETPEHNAKALEAAVDAASVRINDVVRGNGQVASTFNQQAVLSKIQGILEAQLPKADVLLGNNDCVKKYVAQATIWGLQASMNGEKQAVVGPRASSTIFGNTWANVVMVCGVQTPERYQNYVQTGWNSAATILNEMKFHRN